MVHGETVTPHPDPYPDPLPMGEGVHSRRRHESI